MHPDNCISESEMILILGFKFFGKSVQRSKRNCRKLSQPSLLCCRNGNIPVRKRKEQGKKDNENKNTGDEPVVWERLLHGQSSLKAKVDKGIVRVHSKKRETKVQQRKDRRRVQGALREKAMSCRDGSRLFLRQFCFQELDYWRGKQ